MKNFYTRARYDDPEKIFVRYLTDDGAVARDAPRTITERVPEWIAIEPYAVNQNTKPT